MALQRAFARDRRLGWKPNKHDPRDVHFDDLNLAGPVRAGGEKILDVPRVFDQGRTSSCVGQSVAQAICVRERAKGLAYVEPSILDIYWHARRKHLGHWFDAGTYIRSAFQAVRERGCTTASSWPFSEKTLTVNRRPPRYTQREAYTRKGLDYYHLSSVGEDKIQQIDAALDADMPVVCGMQLTESFLEWRGPEVIDVPDTAEKLVGGHAFVIVGTRPGQKLMVNSWSTYWRNFGMAWLTDDLVVDRIRDLTVCNAWPALEAA